MVDIVHHTLIGGAGYLIAAEHGHDLAGMAFVAGSVFPDLDVVFMAFGKRFYLRNHQGITHSLVLAPVYAAGLIGPLVFLAGFDWSMFAAALAGLVVHIGLDLTNTFRIALLSPISSRRMSLDAMFFVDGVALALTAGFYAAWLGFEWRGAAAAYPVAFVAYLGAKFVLQRHVRMKLGCESAIPSAWNPFHFYVLDRRNGRVSTALYDALRGQLRDEHQRTETDPQLSTLAQRSPLYRDMQRILRALEITHVEHDAQGVRIEAADIAVRNFGGKFGKTTLTFDAQGNLVDEHAAI